MYIAIQPNISSPPSQYEIETPGGICSSRKKFFSWNDKLQITAPHGAIVARVTGKFSCFRSRYSFELSDGSVYRSWREKIWKGLLFAKVAKSALASIKTRDSMTPSCKIRLKSRHFPRMP
jgi:uncharacterized protein YxjI